MEMNPNPLRTTGVLMVLPFVAVGGFGTIVYK